MMEQKQCAVLRPVRVERSARRGYVWRDGYAVTFPGGGDLQPWMTKREALAYCKEHGLDFHVEERG